MRALATRVEVRPMFAVRVHTILRVRADRRVFPVLYGNELCTATGCQGKNIAWFPSIWDLSALESPVIINTMLIAQINVGASSTDLGLAADKIVKN